MPGRFYLSRPLATIAKALNAEILPDVLGEPARHNISPGQNIVVCDRERRLRYMRWGLLPVGRVNARGRPVMEMIINARSETVFDKSAFEGVRRAVVPADGWYEWTGKTRQKQAWRIFPKSGGLLFFAAITDVWEAPGGQVLSQVATVTCDPSADVRDIHHRMGVLLNPSDIDTWLLGDPEAARLLMKPFTDGALSVEPADDVDWTSL